MNLKQGGWDLSSFFSEMEEIPEYFVSMPVLFCSAPIDISISKNLLHHRKTCLSYCDKSTVEERGHNTNAMLKRSDTSTISNIES